VMNQQREVIYSLRNFALEGGEEPKGEARKMVEKAVSQRVETSLGVEETAENWDFPLLQQDLLMHYLLHVRELENADQRPTTVEAVQSAAVEAVRAAFEAKLVDLDKVRDDQGVGYGERLLSLVMLNVLDEKWKDHLYDLDQLRNAIHYRSWGQKDPLIEYKQEAYSMFVDLMNDIYNTFTERFLKVQLVFDQPGGMGDGGNGRPPAGPMGPGGAAAPQKKRRYNALGILEDVPDEEEPAPVGGTTATGTEEVMDVAPAEPPKKEVAARRDPVVVGAGKARSLSQAATNTAQMPTDWATVGRNDPCPCGSGKKFKKCHGASL
jgi:preprotein translocase subunit SecA